MAQLGEWRGIKHGMKSAALAWRGMLEGTINPAKGESMTDQETPERAHVTADDIEAANDLIDFIEACPSMFHTAAAACWPRRSRWISRWRDRFSCMQVCRCANTFS